MESDPYPGNGFFLPDRLQCTLKAHKGPVHIAKFNSTGKYVLTGGSDRMIHLFNAKSTSSSPEEEIPIIKTYPSIHSGTILSIDIANDNASFVSSGQDRNVVIWDVSSGSILRKFSNHSGAIHTVLFAGGSTEQQQQRQDILLTAGDDCTVRLYDLRAKSSFKPLMEIKDAKDTILSSAFHQSSSNCYFWSGSVDGCLRMYDLRKGELQQDTFGQPITSIKSSKLGSSLLVSISGTKSSSESNDNRAKHIIFDVQDGSHLQTIQGGLNISFRCNSTFWSNDSTIIAGDENGKIQSWDIVKGEKDTSGTSLWENAHDKAILWIETTSKDGGRMVSSSADGTVKIWSCNQNEMN